MLPPRLLAEPGLSALVLAMLSTLGIFLPQTIRRMALYGTIPVSLIWFIYIDAIVIGLLYLNALAALASFVRRVERELDVIKREMERRDA